MNEFKSAPFYQKKTEKASGNKIRQSGAELNTGNSAANRQ